MKKCAQMTGLMASVFLLLSFNAASPVPEGAYGCQYYSYVVYGEAMTDGQLNKLEPVYKGFQRIKSSEKFFACFDHYRGTRSGKFNVINIGPYDTEAVLYQEINRIREELKAAGYQPAVRFKHLVTGVLRYGDKACD